jgi:hypothetical protein
VAQVAFPVGGEEDVADLIHELFEVQREDRGTFGLDLNEVRDAMVTEASKGVRDLQFGVIDALWGVVVSGVDLDRAELGLRGLAFVEERHFPRWEVHHSDAGHGHGCGVGTGGMARSLFSGRGSVVGVKGDEGGCGSLVFALEDCPWVVGD